MNNQLKIFYPQIFNLSSLINGYNRTKKNIFYITKLSKADKFATKLKLLAKNLKNQTYKPKKKNSSFKIKQSNQIFRYNFNYW